MTRGATVPQSSRAERNREARVLVTHATAGDLATAALLVALESPDSRQPLDLIERAEALAPRRPEIVWLHLMICERLECQATPRIAAHLQALDSDNGLAWASDLDREQSSGADAVTEVIARIGAAPRITFYWNQLEVMIVDALAEADPSRTLATRVADATGVLAAEAIPPLQPISNACRAERLGLPGRRAACEAMAARMEQSSAVLTQSLALDLQERWWPAGSPQREILRAKRRRLDYLLIESRRARWWRTNRDMAVRVHAARETDREEDVELAVLKSLGLPPEPPVNWKDPMRAGTR